MSKRGVGLQRRANQTQRSASFWMDARSAKSAIPTVATFALAFTLVLAWLHQIS